MQSGQTLSSRVWFIAIVLVVSLSQARAQTELNEVHVAARASSDDALHSLGRSATGLIRTTVELVLVPVTVVDESHRIVTGLEQQNFRVFEDKHAQPIKSFWKEDEPVSVGIVLDMSGSRNTKIECAREISCSVTECLESSGRVLFDDFRGRAEAGSEFHAQPR